MLSMNKMKSNFRILLPVVKTPKIQFHLVANREYSSDAGEIKIPKRIPRGPTDILKALSSCVGIDPTAAHYKFHDDPYLIPYSNPSKRTYALSQEAGRKAAQWVRQQHADLFQHKVADPMIEAFVPTETYTDESNVNEDILESLIIKQQVTDVLTVYGILKKRGTEVSVETKQKILELTCFYNCKDPLSEDWVEENWFRQSVQNLKMNNAMSIGKKTWQDGGFAEKLFDEIIQSGGDQNKAHCALIAGMLTHGQVDEAWRRYEECKQKGIKLNVTVYNAIIPKAVYLRDSHELIWQLVLQLLSEMRDLNLRPNLITLNSVLFTLEYIAGNRNAKSNALSTIAEFNNLGIKPSLASYAYLIRIFQRDKKQQSGLLRSIIEKLEANSDALVTPQAPDDNKFFMRAMESINQLGDRVLGDRLDNLLHNAKNYSLIGSSMTESIYYRNYFLLRLNTDEIDAFMDFYHRFVPTLYIPEVSILQEVIKSVEVQMGWKHIPKLWGDIILFDQLRTETVAILLSTAVQAANDDKEQIDAMADMAWSIWDKIESKSVTNVTWTGEMLGDVVTLLLAGKQLARAHIVMTHIDKLQKFIIGEPSAQCFESYIDACLEAVNIDAALRCVKHCRSKERPETEQFLNKIANSGLTLDDQQKRVMAELQSKS